MGMIRRGVSRELAGSSIIIILLVGLAVRALAEEQVEEAVMVLGVIK